jgi:hypothetical protein
VAINVGSVEVDVLPSARGIYGRLQQALVPPATQIGEEVGRIIGRQIATQIAPAVRDGITNGGRTARPAATRQGDETAGAFSRALKARLEAAFRSLPRADVRLSTTGFDADMARLRARLETLSGRRIGIDVDAGVALAEITDIEARLRRLGAQHPNVQVRADTARALAELAALRAEVDAVDGKNVGIDTSSSVSGMQALVTAARAFGPAIIPVLSVVAAGLGAIAAAAVAAGAGIGGIALVAVPAFKQIAGVLQAQKAAQDAATTATLKGGQAASQAAQRSLQMASAQQALATAERNGARQIAQAQQQVVQAKQAAAQAVQQAAQQNEQAARRVQDAERSLADAQVAARQAQQDLTAARRQAAQELEDLNNRLTDAQLSQRDAEIQLKEATAQRDAVLKNANSTELDKQKALLAYDQAVQRLKEQTTETARLKQETAAANKAGVTGSATYTAAQDRLAQAQQNVADQQQAVRDAQTEAARVQVQTAQQVAQAQQRVSEATANVAVAQQNAADAVASAQRQIASASLSAAGGVDQAAVAQSKYQQELAKLSPAARGTLNAFTGLRTAFSAWSRSLQPAVMPLFTRALVGVRDTLPTLTPFVLGAARAIKGLQDRMAAQLKTPFWQGFKDDLQNSVEPAITGLGIAFGNVVTGMAGIIDAFLPHIDGISSTLQRVTGRFADWGKNLKGSPEFERFLSYASEQASVLGQALGSVVGALLKLGVALAPLGGTATSFINALASAINAIPTPVLTFLGVAFSSIAIGARLAAIAIGAWRVAALAASIATKLMTGEQIALNAAQRANLIGIIVTAIMALVVAVIYAYQHFDWFRNAVQAVWAAIKAAAVAVYNWFKGPFVDFFTKTIPGVFNTVINWVKANWPWILGALTGPIGLAVVAIIKYWGDIKAGIVAAWDWIKKNVLYPIRDFFTKTIPGWGTTLKNRVVDSWNLLRTGMSDVWGKTKSSVVYPIRDFFTKTIPGWGITLSNRIVESFDLARAGIKLAWDKIKDIAKKPVKFVVDTVYNEGIRKVWNLVTDAFGGKHLAPMKFATGGIMPGYTPGRDVHLVPSTAGPVALSGGEAIMRPEWTRAVGSGYVNAMNAAARNGGVSGVRGLLGFKDGGIFDTIGNIASGAWDVVKKFNPWMADTFSTSVVAGVDEYVLPAIKKIPGGNIGFVSLLKGLMTDAANKLVVAGTKGDSLATPNIKYSPSAGVEQWRPVVVQALRQVGQPVGLAQSTLRRMQQESGGNPTIVNKTDSNWLAGHPSVGLMQVIGPTFRHYAGKYKDKGPFLYGVSVDPLANIYSSMKYALGAYGSLSRAYDRAGGYDSGGYLQPGLNLAYNGTGRPEPVFTTAQANALTSLAAHGGGASSGPASFTGSLYLDSGEFLGRVRGEAQQVVNANNGQLMTALSARPRR